MKGKPTFDATHFITIIGASRAMKASKALIAASVFHTVEPLPEDHWNFYVKEEAVGTLEGIQKLVNGGKTKGEP